MIQIKKKAFASRVVHTFDNIFFDFKIRLQFESLTFVLSLLNLLDKQFCNNEFYLWLLTMTMILCVHLYCASIRQYNCSVQSSYLLSLASIVRHLQPRIQLQLSKMYFSITYYIFSHNFWILIYQCRLVNIPIAKP